MPGKHIFTTVAFWITAQPSKRIQAVFREWSSSGNETTKMMIDRTSRDKIKKLKTLLAENVADDQIVTLT